MNEFKPWEELPDEGYWHAVLGAPEDGALPRRDAAPPPDAAPATGSAVGTGWALAEASYVEGTTLELRVVGHNRGGLLVDLGDVRGFVPASQLVAFPRQVQEEARMQELARYVSTALRLKVIELDHAHNRLILSERVANPPPSHADEILATIQPQQTCQGVIRNVTDFGAFIDLGGVEGLIHVSELSWQYVKHPREVLSPGQAVTVYVLEVNREQKRIACSLKRLKPNPWTEVAANLHPGDWVSGVVTSVVPFGAFVKIADGVEGLVHVSELAEKSFQHPRDVVQEGQSVQVRVVEINAAKQRMKLSLRQTSPRGNGSGARDNTAWNWSGTPSTEMPPPPPLDPGYWDSLAATG